MHPSIRSVGVLLAVALLFAISLKPVPAQAEPFVSNRITVTVEGRGDDVILISGLASSPRIWRELMRAAPHHRYHLVKVSGFAGQPARDNATGPVAAPVTEEVARYIREAYLKRPAVIGHSMGGTIGLMLASRHPASLSKLMVVDVRPFMGEAFGPLGSTPASLRPLADAFVGPMAGLDAAGWRRQGQLLLAGLIDTAARRNDALEDWVTSNSDVVVRALREVFLTDLRPELPRIRVPTTVLYVTMKANDLTDQQTDAVYRAAYKAVPHVMLERISASAHFIMWDQPGRFTQEVSAFLRCSFCSH